MLYDLRGYHAIADRGARGPVPQQPGSRRPRQRLRQLARLHAGACSTRSRRTTCCRTIAPRSSSCCRRRSRPWTGASAQIARASHGEGPARGLVRGPLNDLTGQGDLGVQPGISLCGPRSLRARARAARPPARRRRAPGRRARSASRSPAGFGAASMRSPLVQLRDGTWTPYVPAEALTPRRLLDQWYATDVDTGAVHLLRLKALPARGVLADALLNDHEDNLFYKGWGIANEPVYNQHATAYLLRDEPEAAVRAFYSYMASAFSHSVFEPVEHRWTHGQYFGPPSTDGAWFELYRNMLVHERDDDALVLAQATPRAWLRDGQKIELERVPTYYGAVSATFESRAGAGEIRADVRMPAARGRRRCSSGSGIPTGKRMQAVTVNGRAWKDFDAAADGCGCRRPPTATRSSSATQRIARRPMWRLGSGCRRSRIPSMPYDPIGRTQPLAEQAAGHCRARSTGRTMRCGLTCRAAVDPGGHMSMIKHLVVSAVLVLASVVPLMGQVGTQGSILGAVVDSSRAALPGATVTVTEPRHRARADRHHRRGRQLRDSRAAHRPLLGHRDDAGLQDVAAGAGRPDRRRTQPRVARARRRRQSPSRSRSSAARRCCRPSAARCRRSCRWSRFASCRSARATRWCSSTWCRACGSPASGGPGTRVHGAGLRHAREPDRVPARWPERERRDGRRRHHHPERGHDRGVQRRDVQLQRRERPQPAADRDGHQVGDERLPRHGLGVQPERQVQRQECLFDWRSRPSCDRNQYGAAVGGPIVRSRTFFFGSFEAHADPARDPLQLRRAVQPAMLQGDFSGLSRAIRDPLHGAAVSRQHHPGRIASRTRRGSSSRTCSRRIHRTGASARSRP